MKTEEEKTEKKSYLVKITIISFLKSVIKMNIIIKKNKKKIRWETPITNSKYFFSNLFLLFALIHIHDIKITLYLCKNLNALYLSNFVFVYPLERVKVTVHQTRYQFNVLFDSLFSNKCNVSFKFNIYIFLILNLNNCKIKIKYKQIYV